MTKADHHTWDLSALYSSDKDPSIQKDLDLLAKLHRSFAKKWQKRSDYLTDPKALKQALDEFERLANFYGDDGKPGYYFFLRSSQNLNDPTIRARQNKVQETGKNNANSIQFFLINLGKVSRSQQKTFGSSPLLKKYQRSLRRLFKQANHVLTDPEEKVMSLMSTSAYQKWAKMLSGFLAKESREVLTESGRKELKNFSELNGLISSQNKKVRDSAGAALHDILSKNADVAENEFNAILETKRVSDNLRGYKRPDAGQHLHDDIDSEVVDTLVKTVSGRFDVSKRFYQLKAKLFGVRSLAYHERAATYGSLKDNYDYPTAVKIVDKSLSKLDAEFAQIFRNFVAQGQIDVFPREGKEGGAYCIMYQPSLPTFILLNHTDKFRDVATLAHEVGHGINNELVRAHQPPVYAGTPLSTAEVASTFMEDFALRELSEGANDEKRLAIIMMKLNDDVATIFRQVGAYRFEQEVHQEYVKQGYLSKDEIGRIFQKHMAAYMGPAVEQSPGSENWWVGWHHFRRPFYVYSYASGLLISKALQRSVKQDPKFVKKVKEFLSAGLSDSPKNIFAKLGIDITNQVFWNQGLDEVDSLLTDATKLAKKLGKI